ncbi:MAG: proB [Anaerosporomusa subterranea]|nr:proB [Anaerosporomusa subterranea]
MVIASGSRDGVVREVVDGQSVGTIFWPKENRLHIRKRWLAFGARICGSVTVDKGCEQAILTGGSSLLSTGVTAVDGEFESGSTIRVLTVEGREIARGLTNYCSRDAQKIMGAHTQEIAGLLGSKPYDELIHRDNLVLMVRGG